MTLDDSKIAALQDLYARGTLTADDVRKALDDANPLPTNGVLSVAALDLIEAGQRFVKGNAQKFFADMAAEMRRPHYGEMQRDWSTAMLTRATEAGLYQP